MVENAHDICGIIKVDADYDSFMTAGVALGQKCWGTVTVLEHTENDSCRVFRIRSLSAQRNLYDYGTLVLMSLRDENNNNNKKPTMR